MRNIKTTINFCGIVCIFLFFINFQVINSKNHNPEAATGQDKVFRAGASTSNITPFPGGGIIGEGGAPEATHIHDELHARCLVQQVQCILVMSQNMCLSAVG